MFVAEQRMDREFQGQDMRVKQLEMYREGVRDLVELTVSKMDIHLIVNTLRLSFCITPFTEGPPDFMKRESQGQDMRVKHFEMYREGDSTL